MSEERIVFSGTLPRQDLKTIEHTAHPEDERQIHEAPCLGGGEVVVEGPKFSPIPIGEEPRDDVGPDTVQKDRMPDYGLNIE